MADLEIEVCERRRVETDLNNELRKFRGLYDLAMAMMSERSFDACLQSIVDKSRELLRSDISLLALHDEKRNTSTSIFGRECSRKLGGTYSSPQTGDSVGWWQASGKGASSMTT